jgi:hypothetical protein
MPANHSIHPRFTRFRASEAVDFDKSGLMETRPLSDAQLAGAQASVDAGVMSGTTVKLLFAMPGMSLTHAWFKSGFPLPRHRHHRFCLHPEPTHLIAAITQDNLVVDEAALLAREEQAEVSDVFRRPLSLDHLH